MPTASLYLPTSSSLPNSATILRRSNPDRPDTHSALGTDNSAFFFAQDNGKATGDGGGLGGQDLESWLALVELPRQAGSRLGRRSG